MPTATAVSAQPSIWARSDKRSSKCPSINSTFHSRFTTWLAPCLTVAYNGRVRVHKYTRMFTHVTVNPNLIKFAMFEACVFGETRQCASRCVRRRGGVLLSLFSTSQRYDAAPRSHKFTRCAGTCPLSVLIPSCARYLLRLPLGWRLDTVPTECAKPPVLYDECAVPAT